MPPDKRAFYQFHASLMEPWDGPASIAFTDGTVIGAVLDRNGLRPSRYWVTADDLVIMASEVGVLDIDPSKVVAQGRLQPGRMFLVDTAQGRIVSDDEIKTTLAAEHPYADWLHAGWSTSTTSPPASPSRPSTRRSSTTSGCSATPPRSSRSSSSPWPAPAPSRSGRWAPTRPSPCCRSGPGCCSTTSSSSSPRSPTRRSTPSARSWSPRWAPPSAPSGTCSSPDRPAAARSTCPGPSSPTTSWPSSSTSTKTATCPASGPSPSTACSRSPVGGRSGSAAAGPRRGVPPG